MTRNKIHGILSDTILEIIVVIPSKGIEPILKKSLYSPPSIPDKVTLQSLCTRVLNADLITMISPQEFEFLIQLILGLNTLRGLKNTNSLQLDLQCLPA
jgi:hypothetical protein